MYKAKAMMFWMIKHNMDPELNSYLAKTRMKVSHRLPKVVAALNTWVIIEKK